MGIYGGGSWLELQRLTKNIDTKLKRKAFFKNYSN